MAKVFEIDLDPDDRTLRQFGWISLVGFGFVATIAWFEVLIFSFGLGAARVPVVYGCGAVAAVAALFSLVWPRGNYPIFVGLSIATYPIGFVLSYVIMGTLYYLVFSPVGLVMRLIGKNPLDLAIDPEAESYWLDAPPARGSKGYFKQF